MEPKLKRRWLHSFGGQITVLTGVIFVLAATLLAIVWQWRDAEMLKVVVLVGAICYIASLMAMLSEKLFVGNAAPSGMLLGMAFRTGIPLAALVIMKIGGGQFAKPEAIVYLMVFYFGALIAHVGLSYCVLHADHSAGHRDYPAK